MGTNSFCFIFEDGSSRDWLKLETIKEVFNSCQHSFIFPGHWNICPNEFWSCFDDDMFSPIALQVCSFQTESYRFNLFVGLFGGVLWQKWLFWNYLFEFVLAEKGDRCRPDNLQSCYHEDQISQILQKYFQVCKKRFFCSN